MILLNCTNNSNLNTIINVNDMENEILEITFRNNSLKNPYLMSSVADLLESMMINVEDDNSKLIVVHNFKNAIINMQDINNDVEKLNTIRPMMNVVKGYSEAGQDIVILTESNDVNSFYTDLLTLPTATLFSDSFKLSGFLSERI